MTDIDPVQRLTLIVTHYLDLLALLALAVGVAWGLWTYVGAFAIAIAAVIVFAGSAIAAARAFPRPAAAAADRARRRQDRAMRRRTFWRGLPGTGRNRTVLLDRGPIA